jgi:hypothetical protein
MVAATLILAFSGALFLYWLRYSCLLILQTRSATASEPASSRSFSFPSVRENLHLADLAPDSLDALEGQLLSDFSILRPLIASTPETGVDPIERWMLVIDYKLLRFWYFATRRTSVSSAKRALAEMSDILGYFASSLGPRLSEIGNA